jgi:hypothetical protein
MYEFKIKEFVPANTIWETAKVYKDKGIIPGYLRGYNIEVTTTDGRTDWLSANYIWGEPEDALNDEYNLWRRSDWGWVPTGRITFRGYYTEHYDFEEREEYVVNADDVNEEVTA